MNVDSIQSSELYTIRAKRQEQTSQQIQEAKQSEQAQNIQQTQQVQSQNAQETDTYDKDNPVGVQAEGVYSLSHDEEGNLTVNYTQPASKSEDTESSSSTKSESSQQASAGAGASSVASTSSDDDEELEELQQQRDAIRQQLNRETDEAVKAQLRVQLQSIETQIALKSAGIDA